MTAIETLHNYFQKHHPQNAEGLEETIAAFEVRNIEKHTLLLAEGEQEVLLRFMVEGSVREFYIGADKESNVNFFTQPHFITDFSSFIYDKPTKKNQQALTEVQLLVLGKERFLALLEKYQCGNDLIQSIFIQLLQHQEAIEYQRHTKSPEQLYECLLTHKAHWLQTIPQYHIASFLGITPETLSRIRKRRS
ncbi:MAG: Crp/Fnr family transcriptional regulator [Aureispira sp.]